MTNEPSSRPFDRPPEGDTRAKALTALVKAMIVVMSEAKPGIVQTIFAQAEGQTDDPAVIDDLMHIWSTMRSPDNGD